MYRNKHGVYKVWHYLWFQATTGGLGICPLWIRGREITIIVLTLKILFVLVPNPRFLIEAIFISQ